MSKASAAALGVGGTISPEESHGRSGSKRYRWYVLGVLTLAYTLNFVDRAMVGVLNEPIRMEFGATDFQMGLLGGMAFALLYTFMGLPLARLAENYDRRKIIAVAIATWSVMTALCGLAGLLNPWLHAAAFVVVLAPLAALFVVRRLWAGLVLVCAAAAGSLLLVPLLAQFGLLAFSLLLISRIGVGVGEAGCAPPSNSLLSSYFPPESRATALATFALGIPLGIVIAAVGGGFLEKHLGWRAAFLWIGLPGLLVAALIWFTVKEQDHVAEPAPDFKTVLQLLFRKATFLHVTFGSALVALVAYATNQFLFAFFARTHGLNAAQTALLFIAVMGFGATLGTFLGGHLGDRFAKRWPSALTGVPGVGLIIAAPLYATAFQMSSSLVATALLTLAAICHNTFIGPALAVTQGLVHPRMRATSLAVFAFIAVLIGYGFGPPFIGFLSDWLASRSFAGPGSFAETCVRAVTAECQTARAHGLQVALTVTVVFYAWAGLHFLLAGRTLRREMIS